MLKIGIENNSEVKVCENNTALALGSGTLAVFATPAMIALMEKTAAQSVENYIDEAQTTVGTKLDVKHVAATPVGMTVKCESKLIDIDRSRLVFEVKAYDETGLIGEGIHERFIVDSEKFLNKTNKKRST